MLTAATAAVTTLNAIALAMSTGTRVGTAASVERIIPVEYSPVMTSAPSTAMVSIPIWKPPETSSAPFIPVTSGAVAGSAAMASRENATARETPVIRTTVAASVHHVDRSENSLIHSPRRVPRKEGRAGVATWVTGTGTAPAAATMVLIGSPPPGWQTWLERRTGTRPRPG